MNIELPYNTEVTIRNNYNNETTIIVEDSYDKLQPALLKAVYEESGHIHLLKAIDNDMFQELLSEREDELHFYLEQNGYVFNKN